MMKKSKTLSINTLNFKGDFYRTVGELPGRIEAILKVNNERLKIVLSGDYKVHPNPDKQFPFIESVKDCDYDFIGGAHPVYRTDEKNHPIEEVKNIKMDTFFPYTSAGIVEFVNKSFGTSFTGLTIK